ncbi:hypothetical protein DKG34_08010 [Streptomyces sp. NWU49]|nr:hypothetical protein DKG34_08010 [Streptomyces sp. NWU49]
MGLGHEAGQQLELQVDEVEFASVQLCRVPRGADADGAASRRAVGREEERNGMRAGRAACPTRDDSRR